MDASDRPDCVIASPANRAFAVLAAPGVAVAVGISEMMPVLAALLVAVCDVNSDHLAVRIRKHHRVLRADSLTAGEDQHCRRNGPQ
jgi:hypothetical protein